MLWGNLDVKNCNAKLTKRIKMKTFFKAIFLLVSISSFAQDAKIKTTINQEVWYTFIDAYEQYDSEAFMAIHSKDLVRLNKEGSKIRDFITYREDMTKGNLKWKQEPGSKKISFSFLNRFYNQDLGFEKGYYKVVYQNPDKDDHVVYGLFEVVLRKENGHWKILVDSDENADIDEDIFLKGEIVQK